MLMPTKTPRWYTTANLRQAWIVGLVFAWSGLTLLVVALTTGPGWLLGGALPCCGIAVPWIVTAIGLSRRPKARPSAPGSSAGAR